MDLSESTVMGEKLRQENAGLRGDLLTLSRRISHDLRSPLGSIVIASELMREILAEVDPASLPTATTLLNSTDELIQLIKRVSFVLEATAVPGVPQLLPMGAAVSATLQRLESRILKSGAVITGPDSWPEVKGVSPWLEVVWWNLLVNALQHGGSPPRIELGWRQENEQFQFWVFDHGPGVALEKCPKLFQPFETLHEPESMRGLGLSIVQRLVALSGGHCAYQPNPAGGACFSFRLPAR